jgi:tetratricopeptide (TPR) repeat protein
MTVVPIEEVRRRRNPLSPQLGVPPAVLAPVLLAESADPPPPVDHRGIILPWLLAALFFFSACMAGTGWWMAAGSGEAPPAKADSIAAAAEDSAPATRPQRAAIDRALADLRSGLPLHALSKLRKVQAENPRIPSIDYLVGLAAVQADEREVAEQALVSSLAKGQRVSDALALQAALAAQAEGGSADTPFGNLEPAPDRLLREAVEADPANPFPCFELAARLRARGDYAAAKEMLEAARVRLQPVDAHTAVDVSLRLLELQETADADLPEILSEATGAADLFGAAYLGFRRGRPEEAVEFLRRAGEILPQDMVAYLAADPSFKTYRNYLRQGWALRAP